MVVAEGERYLVVARRTLCAHGPRGGGTTTVIFVLLSLPQWCIFPELDVDPQTEVVSIFLTVAVAGLAARPIGERLWPELLRKGDAKAAQRLVARERKA